MPTSPGAEKLGEIYVDVLARMDRLEKDYVNIRRKSERAGSDAGAAFSKGFSRLVASIGVAGVLTALIAGLKSATRLAIEQAQAQRVVEQAVRKTGQAAGFTAKELFKQASALQAATGVGDEVTLKKVTNQLLTFQNISGRAFARAQAAVLDLNEVINDGAVGSLSSQAIQLGKALNDPIQGLSALARSGIQFNEAQKEQVRLLVESGQLMEAQSIILDEIEKQYGGQAKAASEAAGGTKQLAAAAGDAAERIGAKLVPIIKTVTPLLTRFFDSIAAGDRETETTISNFDRLSTVLVNLRKKTTLTANEKKILSGVVKELNTRFPNYLKNLDLQNDSLQKIESGVRGARQELEKFIELQIKQDVLKGLEEDFRKFAETSLQAEAALQNLAAITQNIEGQIASQSNPVTFLGNTFFDQKNLNQAVALAKAGYEESLNALVEDANAQKEKLRGKIELLGKEVADLFASTLSPSGGDDSVVNSRLSRPLKLPPIEIEFAPDDDGAQEELKAFLLARTKMLEQLGFAHQDYLDLRKQQIEEEFKAFVAAGVSSADAEQLKTERIKALNQEQSDYVRGLQEAQLSRNQQVLAQLEEQILASINPILSAHQTAAVGLNTLFDQIQVKASTNANIVEQAFVNMANEAIRQIQRILVELAALQLVKGVASLFGFGLPSGLAGAVLGGGVGSASSFGGSGNLVGSVSPNVIPAVSQTLSGSGAQLSSELQQINKSIQALNLNLVAGQSGGSGTEVSLSLAGKASGRELELAIDSTQQVRRRNT